MGYLPVNDPLLPPAALRDYVYHALPVSVPAGFYHIPASLYPTLLVTLRGQVTLHHHGGTPFPRLVICGGTSAPRLAHAAEGTRLLIIALRHGCLPALFAAPAGILREQWAEWREVLPGNASIQALDSLLADSEEAFVIAAVWRTLTTLAAAQKACVPLVLPLVLLQQPLAVMSAQFALSTRQFERRFQLAYGQSVRAYRRQMRCSQLLPALFARPDCALATLALEYGFYDQAHMQRDVRHFTGHTPLALRQAVAQQDPASWAYQAAVRHPRFFGSRGF